MTEAHEKQLSNLMHDLESKDNDEIGKGGKSQQLNPEETSDASQAEKKRQKSQRKKSRQKEAEKQRELQIEEENANAGPSLKDLEQKRMDELYLAPRGLRIIDISADGHCLYRAVAYQLGGENDFWKVRGLCADELKSSESEFSPFAEFEDSYDNYVDRVRSSAEWGGQLELQCLAKALKRQIIVYCAESSPLEIGSIVDNDQDPIRLSYHKHYYALGEHYNAVVSDL